MKNTISFLFFYVLLSCSSSFHVNKIHAQSTIDSTSYYYQIAMNPKNDTDLAMAYNFFIKHKQLCLDKNYLEGAIHDLSLLAIVQNESGFYHDSDASASEALSLLDKVKNSPYSVNSKITLYNELGKASRALMDYERALMYYNMAYAIANSPQERTIIINNRAFVYMDEKEYDLALVEFEKAYEISSKIKDEKEIARNLDNIGFVKHKLHKEDAIILLDSALNLRIKLKDKEGLYASYKHRFQYYAELKDQKNALSNLNHALAVATDLNSESYKLDVLSEYVNLDTDSLIIAYKELNDKFKKENLLSENKYSSKKYDYTNKALEAEKNKNQKQRAQIIIVVVIILGVFSYFLLRARHKRDSIQQVYKTEARISKKIHDELANDLSDIMNYVETDLQVTEEKKTKLLNKLEDVYLRTRDISTETANIDFNDFSNSLRHLLVQHNKKDVQVIIGNIETIDWKVIPEHKKLTVYRCLQELMVNMKKHSQAHVVTVAFKHNMNKNEIWYTDDGQGASLEKITQSGLSNAEFRMKEIGGSLKFETSQGNGFKAFITFYS